MSEHNQQHNQRAKGRRIDMKLRYDLIPVDALKEVARVLALGKEKHKGNNFRDVHLEHNQHIASAFRHGEAYRGGEMMDTEMGTHHLAHRIVRDLYQMQIDMEELSEEPTLKDLYESPKVICTVQTVGDGDA